MRLNAQKLTGEPVRHALSIFELTASCGSEDFVVITDHADTPFNRTDYSQFKYGRRDVAEYYGALIAQALLSHLADVTSGDEPIVVLGTPYKRLPNAARMLAIAAQRHLRLAGLPAVYTTIYQHRLAEGDYGRLSIDERNTRNRLKKRLVDPDDFVGKHVVVVDDVRITGSIERSIAEHLSGIAIKSLTFINLVRLDEAVALANPSLEDKLNHYAVHGLKDIEQLMHGPHGFVLITRVLKYILQSNLSEIRRLLSQLSDHEVTGLFEGTIDEGYDLMPMYHGAFGVIRDDFVVRNERSLPIPHRLVPERIHP